MVILLALITGSATAQTWMRYSPGHTDDLIMDPVNDEFTVLKKLYDNGSDAFFIDQYDHLGNIKGSLPVKSYSGMMKTSDGGYLYRSATSPDTVIKVSSNHVVQWKTPNPSPGFKLAEDVQHNYLSAGTGSVTKMDASGNIVWTKTYSFLSIISISPSVSGYLLAGYSGSTMVLAKTDLNGDTLFTRKYSPTVVPFRYLDTKDGGFLAGTSSMNGYVFRIDANADTLWSRKLDMIPVDFYGDYFFGNGYNKIVKASILTGDTVWTFKTPYDKAVNDIGAHPDGGAVAACSTNFSLESETMLLRLDSDGKLNVNRIRGQISEDLNGNCIKESEDPVLPNVVLKLTPGPLYTFTDSQGRYEFFINSDGAYTITPQINTGQEDYLTNNCATSYSVVFSGIGDVFEDRNFMFRQLVCPNLKVYYNSGNMLRCFKDNRKLVCVNRGKTLASNVTLSLEIPSEYFIKSSSAPYTRTNNKLIFNVGNMASGSTFTVNIVDSLSCNATLQDRLNIRSIASIPATCGVPNANNDTTISFIGVVGSFDPNDKQVFPSTISYADYQANEKELKYLIRFQNTGTAPAVNIKVVDTLPPGLDISSIRDVSTSHPGYYTRWQFVQGSENIIEWIFDLIYLPYKDQDEAASQGYISFTIDLEDGLPDGTEIKNRAAIYFDYNEPVITEPSSVKINSSNTTEKYKANYVDASITSPADNYKVDGPSDILITTNVDDPDEVVDRVEFYQGATLLGTDLEAPFSFEWEDVPVGNYSLSVKAITRESKTYSSSAIDIEVALPNQLPTITITFPSANHVFSSAPATVEISVDATDPDGSIASVDFYEGTNLLGSSFLAPYDYTWSNVPEGSYTIKAVANDNRGAQSQSAQVSISVEELLQTSLTGSQKTTAFSIQPNPFTTSLNIFTRQEEKIILASVYDMNGRKVFEIKNASSVVTLGEELLPGVYSLVLVTEQQSYTQVIIKL